MNAQFIEGHSCSKKKMAHARAAPKKARKTKLVAKKRVVQEKYDEEDEEEELAAKRTALEQVKAARKAHKERERLAIGLRLAMQMLSPDPINFGDRNDQSISQTYGHHCPHCRAPQTTGDILNGASESPYDITTECSKCRMRYATTVEVLIKAQRARFPWLCPQQTIDQFQYWMGKMGDEKDANAVDNLFGERPDIWWNALKYGRDLHGEGMKNDDIVKAFLLGKDNFEK
jgi:hypothetical protein